MKNPFKNSPLTIEELVKWKNNSVVNPRTNKPIKNQGYIFKLINNSYNSNKSEVDKLFNDLNKIVDNETMLLNCNEDRDLISMNLFWVEEDGIRKIVYPKDKIDQLIFYTDSNNIIRGFEKETIKYMKTYNLINHPISTEPIPEYILEQVDLIDITQIQNAKTLENIALDVFQYFSKISIFIDHQSFLNLNKKNLLKFHYELKDFWLKNFGPKERMTIHKAELFEQTEENLTNDSLENIQKYLLSQMEILLKCDIEEYKYMINYIILGALGIVIPQIKEMYPDFSFSFC